MLIKWLIDDLRCLLEGHILWRILFFQLLELTVSVITFEICKLSLTVSLGHGGFMGFKLLYFSWWMQLLLGAKIHVVVLVWGVEAKCFIRLVGRWRCFTLIRFVADTVQITVIHRAHQVLLWRNQGVLTILLINSLVSSLLYWCHRLVFFDFILVIISIENHCCSKVRLITLRVDLILGIVIHINLLLGWCLCDILMDCQLSLHVLVFVTMYFLRWLLNHEIVVLG